MDDESLCMLLMSVRTIAVVGLSDKPSRTSYGIARYLQNVGYRIIPVNPNVREVLDEPAYPDLLSVQDAVDLVNIFRRSQFVAPVVDQAISKGVQAIWMQVGVVDEVAAERAREAGISVVMNRCIMVDHRRLL